MRRMLLPFLLSGALAACSGEFFTGSGSTGGGGSNGGGTGTGTGGGNTGGVTYPVCEPGSAPTVFKNALCVCRDLVDVGAILVKDGPTDEPPTMGVNGRMDLASYLDADGGLIAFGGLDALINVEVRDSLVTNGNLSLGGRLKVGQDLMVAGNLSVLGALEVDGVLGVAGSQAVIGGKEVGSYGAFVPPNGRPCACGTGIIDVKARVAQAKGNNDNAKAHLPPNPVNIIGTTELVLNTGRYFFATKQSLGYVKIVANGAVEIYVDDDLDALGHDRFRITDGSTLDVFVSGNVYTVGHMLYGEKHHPAAFRLYVGGNKETSLQVGNQVFRGSLYAPNATLTYVGRTMIEGSLLAGTLKSAGLLELYFARPTTGSNGKPCTPPGGSPPPEDDEPDPADIPDIENM